MLYFNLTSPNPNFEGRKNLKRIIPQVRDAIKFTIPDVQSPNKLSSPANEMETATLNELKQKLGFVRAFIKTLFPDGGIPEYFRGQIGIVKTFKVAQCDEFAEISKTALIINGVKNADMFQICAQKLNSNEPPRSLDHVITAIGVKKKYNNKKTPRPFIPNPNTKILDMYLNGYIGTIKNAKKKYKIFGLKPDEILMLKPIKTFEHTPESINTVSKNFPSLLIKKQP